MTAGLSHSLLGRRSDRKTEGHLPLILSILLVSITLWGFWNLQFNDFVNFDDHDYITRNTHVNSGLRFQNLVWAFTSFHSYNWHPVTWLSHMLDVELYGLNPMGHHWNSLLLHIANTLLLFLLLRTMSGATWRSAAAAALFAIHPLHVESVAWASERKDVLSGFFWMLAMIAYVGYTRKPDWKRYSLSLLFFALGLMSKPMAVTLPFALLLIDYWPLRRLHRPPGSNGWILFLKRCIEKTPFLVLSALVSILTFSIQKASGAIAVELSLSTRISNSLVSYVRYILKMLWPVDLACFYPHPMDALDKWQIFGSLLLLSTATILAFRFRKDHPFLPVGWLWFVGTLIPVIGLIQVGEQALADRYTYIPLIGLFVLVSWGAAAIAGKMALPNFVFRTVIGMIFSLLILLTIHQVEFWKDSLSLFQHEVQVNKGSFLSHFHLGRSMEEQGSLEQARQEYLEALRIRPGFQLAHYQLGNLLTRLGRSLDALHYLSKALELNPQDYKAHNNMGFVLLKEGRFQEAVDHFSEALRINPEERMARHNLDLALRKLQKSVTP